MNETTKMVLVTTLICAFSATLLASLKMGLDERITRQEDIYVRGPAIRAVLKGCPNDPLEDKITLDTGTEKISVYPWIEEGKVRRVAVERPGHGGYGGDVMVMTAVDLETNRVFGVQVTQFKETPGVGTRAMTPEYLARFNTLPISSPIKLRKDGGTIDAVSGATRTSTAIADGVNQAATFIRKYKSAILDAVKNNTVTTRRTS